MSEREIELLAEIARLKECPRPTKMGEHACAHRQQCWEPCGDLGHHEEYAVGVARGDAPDLGLRARPDDPAPHS